MHRLILVFTLFYSTFFFAQVGVTVAGNIAKKKDYFKIHFGDLPIIKHTFDFNAKKDNVSQLSVYNPISKFNDVYYSKNGNYYPLSPRIVLENNLMGTKKDSFNPYGATNLGSAIVMGLITVLFEKQ
nr:hypothetical protein [uncultured Flavobacterium sp.]